MKKIFYLMSVCALAFISCQKEEMEGLPQAGGKFIYEFVASHLPEAKATIGEKVESQWPVLWSKGDQMGVYKADGTFVGIATVSDESEGQNSGKFSVKSDVELTAGDNLYFSYPYVANAEIKTGKVAAEQTLGASGVGANAIAYATVQYNPGNTEFVLTHTNAYLKFNIKSEEFAGYNLAGVTLWADGAELAGNVTIADGGALTVSAAEDYVKASLATPVAVSASDAQTVCVAALPVDLAGKTVYAIVHMKGVVGTETATHTVELPIRLNGAGSLNAGSVTEIDLPFLTTALAPKWYEPVETRYVAAYGKGWSYGDENTYVFTKSDQEQTISFKARGNFMKVKEPKYIQTKWECDMSAGAKNVVYFNGTNSFDTSSYREVELADDCSVRIKMVRSFTTTASNGVAWVNVGCLSAVLIKDSEHKVIWGANLWMALQPFEHIQYENGTILDRNLGADVHSKKPSWKANGLYFQWGRPWAYNKNGYFDQANAIDVTSLEVSAQNPYTMYYYNGEPYNWYAGTEDLKDLWGNPNTSDESNASASGVKSIYDPCPHGYRVVSSAIIAELEDKYTIETTTSADNGVGEACNLVYKGAYWPFAGGYWNSGGSKNWQTEAKALAAYWSNSSHNTSIDYGRLLYYRQYNSAGSAVTPPQSNKSQSRAGAYPVRCMVDTENR